jgi:hypothetical protein
VVMAVDAPFMLVVAVGRAKHCRADGTCKMLNVIFAVQGCDIRPSESLATVVT